jgi:ribonuclease BN (tRNA processing enzyme)
VRLTVLGSSASYPGPGQACSGHLVQAGDVTIMADCGNGTLANLAKVIDPLTLDAVFITHAHADHFLDLYALQALLRYAPTGPAAPVALYLPEGLFERMGCILSERGRSDMAEAFVPHELSSGVPVSIGEVQVTPLAMVHEGPTFALVFEDGEKRLCYTSDTALSEDVVHAAHQVDVLVTEATLPEGYGGLAPHMTAAEAGLVAQRASVKKLVLSHLWPTTSREDILEQASSAFEGEIIVAEELRVVEA